jgi:hypothetical protein
MGGRQVSRSNQSNLLVRPPCGARMSDDGWMAFVVDPIEQLHTLADLRKQGLLSAEEYERQKSKIIDL